MLIERKVERFAAFDAPGFMNQLKMRTALQPTLLAGWPARYSE
jgi:hypothetical protein